MRSYLTPATRIGVLGLHEIKEILLHMLFQININIQNVFHMKKRVHVKPREGFWKKENKTRIDYQCIIRGINKLFFHSAIISY